MPKAKSPPREPAAVLSGPDAPATSATRRIRLVGGFAALAALFAALGFVWMRGRTQAVNGATISMAAKTEDPALPVDLLPPPDGMRVSVPLAASERAYLAEIEHRGLTLSARVFTVLAGAIRDADREKLASLLAPTFAGETLDLSEARGPANDSFVIRRVSAAEGAKPGRVNADEFVNYLLKLRERFGKPPTVKLPLPDGSCCRDGQPLFPVLPFTPGAEEPPTMTIHVGLTSLAPVSRERLDGAWSGGCNIRMVGLTRDGLAETSLKLAFDALRIADVDAIAGDTGWIQSLRVQEAQEQSAPRPLMLETAKARGIDTERFADCWNAPDPARRPVTTGGVFLSDLDGDGRIDMLVTDAGRGALFRGLDGGKFEDVTAKSALPPRCAGIAAFGDFDGDRLPDLILNTGVFRNAGGFRFEDVTGKCTLRLPKGAMGYTVADYDRDGRLDLYVARSTGPQPREGRNSWIDGPGGPGNLLCRNLGDWRFEDVSEKANATAGHRSCFTAAWLDADSDGWPDIYAINEFGGGVLLLNRGDGTFREQPLVDDAGDFGSMGMAVGDVDNDGNIDIFTANMYSKAGRRIFENLSPGTYPPEVFAKIKRFVTGSELYRNRGGLKFERTGNAKRLNAVGWSYGAAFVDLDNNGFLDLYATAGFISVARDKPDG
ncbi:MAG: ASPIC and [Planctomycetota bacterium]|nr:MAG: ASPIC and [Planctomycetota bacterium]